MTISSKATALGIILLCQVGAMTVWFAATGALALQGRGAESPLQAGLLTSAVQAGFVAGTLVSALLSLPDRFDPRRLFAAAALAAAAATALLAELPATGPLPIGLRLVTGAAMAGIYPVGMRLVASWARPGRAGDLGLLIGLLVGALTLGSATPHLLAALPGLEAAQLYRAAAGIAALAGLAITLAPLGPNLARAARIDPARMAQAWRNRPLRLANLGYLGHMWELYAMWAWLAAFLRSSFRAAALPSPELAAEAVTFAAIAVGALGAGLAGALADRLGRTAITIAAMATSATCALLIGHLGAAPPALLIAVALLWGVAVIADSAQFSASIAELAEPGSVGTLLTAQTCAGFLLTLASIQLVPPIAAALGWAGAFTTLAIGPLLGCVAMAALRRDPAARRLAGGRR